MVESDHFPDVRKVIEAGKGAQHVIALCDEQNLPKSVHRDEQIPGIIAIA